MTQILVDVDELVCYSCHMKGYLSIEEGDQILFECSKCGDTHKSAKIMDGSITASQIQ